jgi:hypothetical protein
MESNGLQCIITYKICSDGSIYETDWTHLRQNKESSNHSQFFKQYQELKRSEREKYIFRFKRLSCFSCVIKKIKLTSQLMVFFTVVGNNGNWHACT